jgi:hypothetical protein
LVPRRRRATAEEDRRRKIETFRRKLRGYRYVAEPAVVYLALTGGSVLACGALAALTAGSANAFAAAFSRSIVVQIGTLVILPLLASLTIRNLGGWWLARSKARRRIPCSHCGCATAIHTPWECPHCRERNDATSFYAFLNRCRSCWREPEGWWCDRCGGKVALVPAIVARTGDGDDVPCAKRIGWTPPPPPPLTTGAASKDIGTKAPREFVAEPRPPLDRQSLPPFREDPRQGLIEAFGLPETASVEAISAAFEESRDSDAKTYLAREKEALERAARLATVREGAWPKQSPLPMSPRPPRGIQPEGDANNEDAAAAARQRIIGHLGASRQASWSELQDYFDQADSDTKATMNAEDAARLQRMAAAERKAAALAIGGR